MTALALGLAWARPQAGWALLLPVLFLLLVRLAERPRTVVIGTLALWDEESLARPRGARARGPLPPWARAFAAALVLGALAWLGPRPARAPVARTWTCVVDLSPSLALPAGPETRLERALASAEAWLAAQARSGDRVRWRAAGRAALELPVGERPAKPWLTPDARSAAEPDWALVDRPGTLWITDRVPPGTRQAAGLFTSGGAAVPGAIAADGRTTVVFEMERLESRPTESAPAVLVRVPEGGALPPVLARVLQAWCEARGLARAEIPGPAVVLTLALECGPESVSVACARDGWSARGRAAVGGVAAALADDGEDWLVARPLGAQPSVLVRAARGELRVALCALDEPGGDGALFALSWARLFERWALPAPGVLSLTERLDAGAPVSAGGAPATESGARAPGLALYADAGLALLAAGAVLLGLAGVTRPAAARPRGLTAASSRR